MKRHTRLLVLVAAAPTVLVAVAIAAAMGANGAKTAKPVVAVRRPVSSRLYHLIKTLARARPAAASSHPVPVAVLEGTTQQVGISPSAAVFAGGVYPTWIIPGSTEVCLMHGALGRLGTAGGICGLISAFEQRGLAEVAEVSSGVKVVLGLVPSGNVSVEVTNSDGSTESVPVADNVYEITSGEPVSVTLKNAGGATTTRRLPVITSSPPPSAPAG